jgi:uncharacterized membrane protein YagU involved in acid resistance
VLTRIGVEIAIGAVAGLIATKVTDYAEGALLKATPSSWKAREPDTIEDSSAKSAARLLLEQAGRKPAAGELDLAKKTIHYGLGLAWGPVYYLLRRRGGMGPVSAGIASGLALSLAVDETLNPALGITPPAREYPLSAHLRGLLTHVLWGLTVAGIAEALRHTRHLSPSGTERRARRSRGGSIDS